MKKKLLLLPLIAILSYVVLQGNSGGAARRSGVDGSGIHGGSGCGTCHGSSATSSTTVSLVLDSAGTTVTRYVAGGSYTIKLVGTNTSSSSLPMFGFQLGVARASGAGTSSAADGGTLPTSGLPTGTRNYAFSSSLHIIEQSSSLSPSSGSGGSGTTYSVSIPWTAPSSGTGSVKIFAVINAVNNNGSSDAGDKWNRTNVTITELVAASVASITGTTTTCVGSSSTLADSTAGGTWSSSNTSIARIDSTGRVTGVAAGSCVISYATGSGTATTTFTVSGSPYVSTISGVTTMCNGTTTTMFDSTAGGTWSSSSSSLATINPSTGVVRAVAVGTVTISYSVSSTCGTSVATHTINITGAPTVASIAGSSTICRGATTRLTDSTAGGVWTSGSSSIATIDSTGTVRGISTGTAVISYAVTNSCGTTVVTRSVTVSSGTSVSAISGPTTVCVGSNITLIDSTTGGTWSISGSSIATVGSSTGVVTGIAAGTVIVSYGVTGSCGTSYATYPVVVTSAPSAGVILGASGICLGSPVTFTDSGASGGVWTSSNPSIATINSTTGVASFVSSGAATISYTVTGICGTAAATRSVTVGHGPSAGVITGPSTVCPGAFITLVDSAGTSGGSWTSFSPTVATVSSAGVVGGSGVGTTAITYTVTNSCGTASTTAIITVSSGASAGAITGASTVCTGATITLGDSTGASGGTWSSSNTSIVTVSSTGVVHGITNGTATISYTVTSSCGAVSATASVSVISVPGTGIITGPDSLCAGTSATYTDPMSATWSTSNPAIATISTGGILSAVSGGTVIITYSASNACGTNMSRKTVHVLPAAASLAGTISGASAVCIGDSASLTTTGSGGTWSSSNSGVVAVSASGRVTGIASGTAVISYAASNSCGSAVATFTVTVSAAPAVAAISGSTVVCVGGVTTLSDATSGGTWSITPATVASINSTGLATGLTAGTATVSYTITNSCGATVRTFSLTVNAAPATPSAITGSSTACTGASTALSNATTGGTWSSSAPSVASINSSGLVFGNAAGSAIISYTVTNACGTATRTLALTVNSSPNAGTVSGASTICTGTSSTYANTVAGGTWSSSNPSVASISASGVVTGVTAGTAVITYSVTTSCGTATATSTVNVIPSAVAGTISGAAATCPGSSIGLTTTGTGGTWSSSSPSVATVSSTGVVTGITAGTTIVSYAVSNSCGTVVATKTITVGNAPNAGVVTGSSNVCSALSITLVDSTTGGTWRSSNNSIATVSSTGVVTGVSAGTVTISYTVTTSCGSATAAKIITVGSLPTAGTISGPATLCTGGTGTLSSTVSGGSWISSNTSVATIGSSTGVVHAVTAGTAVITYYVSSTCATAIATATINVTASASAGTISGLGTVCRGATTTLTDAVGGGTWSSSNTSVASVNAGTGVVSGIASGSATITYSITSGCGTAIATKSMAVNPTPTVSAITGPTSVCAGATITLSNSVSGGGWISSNTSRATVNSTGVVTGITAGTTTITYFVSNSCGTSTATASVTVNASSAGAISGLSTVAVGASIPLTASISGGTWTSRNTSIATVSSAGVVRGVAAGVDTVVYTVTSSCGTASVSKVITVTAHREAGAAPIATEISGTLNVYPNPSSGAFTVEMPEGTATATVLISDLSGRVMEVRTGEEKMMYFMLSNAAAGTYIIRVNADGNVYTQKVIVQ